MIIKAPTGLYRSILPSGREAGNVTFVISSNDPPKTGELFLQLPPVEDQRSAPDRVFNKLDSRKFLGNLVFDITVSGISSSGSGTKQFEIGEILDFNNAENRNVDVYELESIELRQDTNVVDFERHGISKSEYEELVRNARKQMNEITEEIAKLGTQLKANTDNVSANQAEINQSNKLLDNIVVVQGENNDLVDKVKSVIAQKEEEKTDLLNKRDELQNQIDELRDRLHKVREVVR